MTVIGRLTSDHSAHITLVLLESGGVHEVIVDTGFNDSLYLPEDRIAAWGLPFIASVPVALADQNIVIADVYQANVVWFGLQLRVTVLAAPSGCDSLLGMKLLEGCRIELDTRTDEVRIEQLQPS